MHIATVHSVDFKLRGIIGCGCVVTDEGEKEVKRPPLAVALSSRRSSYMGMTSDISSEELSEEEEEESGSDMFEESSSSSE